MSEGFDRLVEVVRRLRAPDGCPWDIEQTHRSLVDGLLDEVYEFLETIDNSDDKGMREELGDILLQVVFHAQIATEEQRFTVDEVAHEITDKLIYRHPHVFGTEKVSGTDEVLKNWEALKRAEKKDERQSALDGIAPRLPGLLRAEKLQKRAARSGFDWAELGPVLAKVKEEIAELEAEIEKSSDTDTVALELGDVLFSLVNLSRHLDINAEDALRRSSNKFESRFRSLEKIVKDRGHEVHDLSLQALDTIWDEVKVTEDSNKSDQ